jgi:hypothetical protein
MLWQGIPLPPNSKHHLASSVFMPKGTCKYLERLSRNSLGITAVSYFLATEFANNETRKTKALILHSTRLARNKFHIISVGKLNTVYINNEITKVISNNGRYNEAETPISACMSAVCRYTSENCIGIPNFEVSALSIPSL